MKTRITPPSREVEQHARSRAEAIADGLFAHQVEGVAFLLGRRHAILADDMGLGKTRQSIVALTEAAPDGPTRHRQLRHPRSPDRQPARARMGGHRVR